MMLFFGFFFFNDTATTEIYTLSLHDALPICRAPHPGRSAAGRTPGPQRGAGGRSEEHTSELHSRPHLVCRLLLEKNRSPNNRKETNQRRAAPQSCFTNSFVHTSNIKCIHAMH